MPEPGLEHPVVLAIAIATGALIAFLTLALVLLGVGPAGAVGAALVIAAWAGAVREIGRRARSGRWPFRGVEATDA